MRKATPLLVVAVIVALSWLAVALLPATAFYPVVDYAIGDVRFTVLRRGEPDEALCGRAASAVTDTLKRACPSCIYASRCGRGIDAAHREALSTGPIALASLRSGDGAVVMTVSAASDKGALEVCKAIEAQSATQVAAVRLRCFAPGTQRR